VICARFVWPIESTELFVSAGTQSAWHAQGNGLLDKGNARFAELKFGVPANSWRTNESIKAGDKIASLFGLTDR
jgi:hypothetical protein